MALLMAGREDEARQECYPLSEFASNDIEIIKEDMNHV